MIFGSSFVKKIKRELWEGVNLKGYNKSSLIGLRVDGG